MTTAIRTSSRASPRASGGAVASLPGGSTNLASVAAALMIALVLGIISVPACGCFVFSIAAIVLGVLGRKEVDGSGGAKKGRGLATAGLITGAVSLALAVIINVLVFSGALDLNYGYYDSDN